ncbi:putative aspartic protease [Hibiscus syriacus]|uniref:Aspartic protease n=1 Tax=Hibiscus syriacus TaxID=106335 RepID=A0A6A2Z5Q9_HIBSY|nr:aspartic proteinase CDR1 [Hibiscus syriacus]KAE8687331.1 putative aspartic protease [Hibiscus syriacus]
MASFLFAILVLSSSLCLIDAHNGGFSVELIHRDSVKSPFYNPSETASDRITNALRRSFNRVNHFKPSSVSTKTVEADIIVNSGEYLMNISIGTPGFDIVAIADTGSDLIWTQCKPCSQCFTQEAPLFDPSKSSTYRKLSCSASQCGSFQQSSCSTDDTCQYSVGYGDKSFSRGNLAADTLNLASTTGRPVAVPKTVIGCGLDNGGTFNEKSSGIIGLGGGKVSLISQLGTSIEGKFSYCLLPISETGKSTKLNFGSNAVVSGAGVVSTPLVKSTPDTFYYLTLEAISVGTKRIDFTGSSPGSGEGNIIIDSGTTLTLLPSDFYSDLESAVDSQINATRAEGPQGLSLCYEAQNDIEVPAITVHFTNADVELKPLNTFVRVSDTTVCFTFTANNDFAIYGNLAQMNFLVGYDTEKQTVSFKPTDCSKN